MDDEDDVPRLSADTLKLLREFRADEDARAKEFEKLKDQAESDFENGAAGLSMDFFGEDWNASQFWYTDATAETLANQLLADLQPSSAIAIVSAPSVYVAIRRIIARDSSLQKPKLRLLEFDRRFELFGDDFVFYDFEQPLRLPAELKGAFDRIICDPPFLSEDCQTKAAITVRFLARTWPEKSADGLRFITCTGERCETTIAKLYAKIGAQTTTFEPKHSKGLSNEFRCYSNFTCDDWTFEGC